MPLDPEFKDQWTTELRSGRYSQGSGYLRTITDKYCCLGAAADLINPYRWVVAAASEGSYCWAENNDVDLPPETLEAIGLSEGSMAELMTMNDDGSTFGDIAQWIEEHL